MADTNVLDALTKILGDLLFDDSLVLSEETKRMDVPGWDSFAYINFIVVTEIHFDIKFSVAEVESFVTVGEIAARIETLSRG